MRTHLGRLWTGWRLLAVTGGVIALVSLGVAADEAPAPAVVATLKGHTEPVYGVAFSPDGKYLATASFDKSLKLWEVPDGKEVKTFAGPQGHQNLVLAVAFSPDGQFLASGSQDNSARVWDVPGGKPLRMFAHADAVNAVALSPDSLRIAGAGKDGTVRVWTTADGKQVFELKGHTGPVTGVAYSPNGQFLVSTGSDQTLRFWNPANGQAVATLGAHEAAVTGLAVNPNGAAVYTAGEDGTLNFWQLPVMAPRPLPAHPAAVTALTLTPDGNQVVSGSKDGTVAVANFGNAQSIRRMAAGAPLTAVGLAPSLVVAGTDDGRLFGWNPGDGKLLTRPIAHAGAVTGMAVSPGGNQFVTGGADGLLKVWALPPVPERVLAHPDAVLAAAVSADGRRIVTGGADKVVRTWLVNGNQAQLERQFAAPAAVRVVAVNGNGQVVASGGADGSARVWDLGTGKERLVLSSPAGPPTALSLNPAGDLLLAAAADGTLKLWRLQVPPPKAPVWQAKAGGAVRAAVFSPRGDRVLSAGDDKMIRHWAVADGKALGAIAAHEGAVTGLAVTPDGARAISAGADKAVKFWDLTPPKPGQAPDNKALATLALPGGAGAVAINGNGTRLAVTFAAKAGPQVRVYDTTTGKELVTMAPHAAAITGLGLLPDNRTLVTASADKSVKLSDIGALAAIEAHAGGVGAVAFHPNGGQAVTGGADKAVKLWDLAGGKLVRTLGPTAEAVTAVAVSRDGAQVAAAAGKTVTVWNAADGKPVTTLAHPAETTSVSFSGDRTKLVTGAADGRARVWDVATGLELQWVGHGGPVRGVAFHPNNTAVVSAGDDRNVTISTVHGVRSVRAAPGALRGIAVTPSGSHVMAAVDKDVVLWNTGNGMKEARTLGGEGPATVVAAARNGVLVAAAGADQSVRLYTFADGKMVGVIKAPGPVQALAFSPNSQLLGAACGDKALTVWNVTYNPGQPPPAEFGKPVQGYAHAAAVTDVAFAPDNIHLYSSGLDKAVNAWKIASDVPLKNFGHPNLVDAVAFDPAGKLLATGCHDGIVRIWDVEKGNQVRQINAHVKPMSTDVAVYSVAWSHDGKQLLSASLDHSLKIWNAATGNLVRELKGYQEKDAPKGHHEGVFCAAFSPDDKLIASGSSDHMIKLWDAAKGTVVRDFVNPHVKVAAAGPLPAVPQAHPGWVYGLRFTADGKRLVSAGNAPQNHGYLAVWQVADGKLLAGEELPLGPCFTLAVSPDDKLVALGCGGRTVQTQDYHAYLLKMPE